MLHGFGFGLMVWVLLIWLLSVVSCCLWVCCGCFSGLSGVRVFVWGWYNTVFTGFAGFDLGL